MADSTMNQEMNVFSRIIGIFISPRETFESIDQKPNWLVPFLILAVCVVVMQMITMDIGIKDQIAIMEARNVPQERIDLVQSRMAGPARYIGLVSAPIAILVFWAALAGILLFSGNTIMGGQTVFKNLFSMVAWSSLIGVLGIAVKTFLIVTKGTTIGLTTSLASLLPTPPIEQDPSIFYRLLSKFDIFTIWELFLWTVGLSVIYRFTTRKSATMVLSLWAVWIIVSVSLSGVLGGIFGQ